MSNPEVLTCPNCHKEIVSLTAAIREGQWIAICHCNHCGQVTEYTVGPVGELENDDTIDES